MSAEQQTLARLIKEAGPQGTVALTGAGISTPSGIPDFRGAGGLWEQRDPMEVAHIDVFRLDPEKFWRFYRERLDVAEGVDPNPAHYALAELEQRGYLSGVITQNIDGLHSRAGSQKVYEVHGSVRTLSCLECGHTVSRAEAENLFAENGVPYCTVCFKSEKRLLALKPDVVLFGEQLPIQEQATAYDLSSQAQLMICIGSSLIVQPVGSLPELVIGRSKLAIVNASKTPYNREAEVVLDGDVAEELSRVLELIE